MLHNTSLINDLPFKPIPFSAGMAQDIWDGRKTQTRRIIKSPVKLPNGFTWDIQNEDQFGRMFGKSFSMKTPYEVGQILWVREPVKIVECDCRYHRSFVSYRFADGTKGKCRIPQRLENEHGAAPMWAMNCGGVPNGCIREMARTFIKITKVRVERLQDGGDREFWGEQKWAENPWVWVFEFGVVT